MSDLLESASTQYTMPTRRQFLQLIAATAGLALPNFPLPVDAAESNLSLGFSLYGMKSLPVAEALKACAEIGYHNVELPLNTGFPTEPGRLSAVDRASLRESLGRHQLTVSGLMNNLSLVVDDAAHAKNLEHIKIAAEFAYELSPGAPPILESVLGGKPAEWGELKERMADRVRDWARTAAENKLTICLKAHVNSAVNSPERLLWLHAQAASPFVKLCYDYSHFELQGMEMEATLKPLISETRFIHVKDSAGDAKKVQFLLPGEGRTDYAQFAKLLKQSGWRGPVVVEVSAMIFNKPGYDPVAAAKQSFAMLAQKLGFNPELRR
jgi:sugar phosphate isomerase/epimerase